MDHPVLRRTLTRRRGAAIAAACAALLAVPTAASAADITVSTLPTDATVLTDSYALLSGVINPGGNATLYRFDWGPTAAYGNSTPATSAGNGTSEVPVDVSLDTLAPNTVYHYRLVAWPTSASDPSQAINGADQTFKTAAPLTIKFLKPRIRVNSNGIALVNLEAVGPQDTTAEGTVTLKAIIKGAPRSIGTFPYTVDTGKKKSLSIPISVVGLRALRAAAHKRLAIRVTAKTSGIKQPVVKKLTLVG